MRFWTGRCTSKIRLDGKTAIITGANTGIGKCTALDFYKRRCTVIMACRDTERAGKARDEIYESLKNVANTGNLVVKKLDLASIKSIKMFAEDILKEVTEIHLLVNNAGVCFCSKSYTEDGFELQFGTNHLGHFLLTVLLLPKLIESGSSRIIVLSSLFHKFGTIDFDNLNSEISYDCVSAYNNSKLANLLFAKELARRLEGTDVHVYAVHPGIAKTEIDRHVKDFVIHLPVASFIYIWIWPYIIKTPEQGAQTTIYCSVDEKVQNETGFYYADCKLANLSAKASDMNVAEKLWKVSWDLLKLNDYDPFENNLTKKQKDKI